MPAAKRSLPATAIPDFTSFDTHRTPSNSKQVGLIDRTPYNRGYPIDPIKLPRIFGDELRPAAFPTPLTPHHFRFMHVVRILLLPHTLFYFPFCSTAGAVDWQHVCVLWMLDLRRETAANWKCRWRVWWAVMRMGAFRHQSRCSFRWAVGGWLAVCPRDLVLRVSSCGARTTNSATHSRPPHTSRPSPSCLFHTGIIGKFQIRARARHHRQTVSKSVPLAGWLARGPMWATSASWARQENELLVFCPLRLPVRSVGPLGCRERGRRATAALFAAR
ncbi:hypothetical protein IWX90DRAFT_280983 [Phyllosticta citrichinensis]|uniref:Uncharacterized protein n=1 Tax=Phyllosticta citrichinensis TaxID=1130410 RepID=A0ABR1XNP0_9PEZI